MCFVSFRVVFEFYYDKFLRWHTHRRVCSKTMRKTDVGKAMGKTHGGKFCIVRAWARGEALVNSFGRGSHCRRRMIVKFTINI